MNPTIPLGPYHPALEEPYRIDVVCEGERIIDATISIGFNFRGIEWLAERKDYVQDIALLERVCGICSNIHSTMFCRAVETIADIEVPPRGQYIRVIMAELERIHSHLLWAGIACHVIGFETLFMTIFALREQVQDALEAISGNRVNYGMNRPGGVNRDITDPAVVKAAAKAVSTATTEQLIPMLTTNKTVRARCVGVGVLTREGALAYGARGAVARASGLTLDVRKDDPYEAYGQLDFDVPVLTDGDVFARVVVRALEVVQSCRIIDQAIDAMPAGPVASALYPHVPPGEAAIHGEAPRGEVLYYLQSDGSEHPARVRVRTPTFFNMPTVRCMVIGQSLSDLGLIQASIDPCYSCADR